MRGIQQSSEERERQAIQTSSQLRPDGGEEVDPTSESSDESAETEDAGGNEGTTVLYLDLKGLFLNLLGIEVDLNEVELDISAVPNPGALLGNLLSAVTGLFDKGPLARLKDRLSQFELPSLSDYLPSTDGSILSEPLYRIINSFLDVLIDVLAEEEQTQEE